MNYMKVGSKGIGDVVGNWDADVVNKNGLCCAERGLFVANTYF